MHQSLIVSLTEFEDSSALGATSMKFVKKSV